MKTIKKLSLLLLGICMAFLIASCEDVTEEYTVSFKVGNEIVSTQTLSSIDELVLPEDLGRNGYTLVWTLEDGSELSSDYELAKDFVLYAKYIANTYVLSFEAEGVENVNVVYKTAISELPAVPVKEGYDGVWEIDGEVITAETIWNYNVNQTAVAAYTAKGYTLSFSGVETAINSIYVTYDQEDIVLPEVPAKKGYNAGGWKIEEEEFSSIAKWNYTEDKTAVAEYTLKTDLPYTITYYFEGENGYTPDESKTLTLYGSYGEQVTYTGYETLDIEGFAFNEDAEGSVLSATIDDEQVAELKLFYDKVLFDGTNNRKIEGLTLTGSRSESGKTAVYISGDKILQSVGGFNSGETISIITGVGGLLYNGETFNATIRATESAAFYVDGLNANEGDVLTVKEGTAFIPNNSTKVCYVVDKDYNLVYAKYDTDKYQWAFDFGNVLTFGYIPYNNTRYFGSNLFDLFGSGYFTLVSGSIKYNGGNVGNLWVGQASENSAFWIGEIPTGSIPVGSKIEIEEGTALVNKTSGTNLYRTATAYTLVWDGTYWEVLYEVLTISGSDVGKQYISSNYATLYSTGDWATQPSVGTVLYNGEAANLTWQSVSISEGWNTELYCAALDPAEGDTLEFKAGFGFVRSGGIYVLAEDVTLIFIADEWGIYDITKIFDGTDYRTIENLTLTGSRGESGKTTVYISGDKILQSVGGFSNWEAISTVSGVGGVLYNGETFNATFRAVEFAAFYIEGLNANEGDVLTIRKGTAFIPNNSTEICYVVDKDYNLIYAKYDTDKYQWAFDYGNVLTFGYIPYNNTRYLGSNLFDLSGSGYFTLVSGSIKYNGGNVSNLWVGQASGNSAFWIGEIPTGSIPVGSKIEIEEGTALVNKTTGTNLYRTARAYTLVWDGTYWEELRESLTISGSTVGKKYIGSNYATLYSAGDWASQPSVGTVLYNGEAANLTWQSVSISEGWNTELYCDALDPVEGDTLEFKAGFGFISSGVVYVLAEDVTLAFTGGKWVKQ